MIEYGITKGGNLIRIGFTFEQAKSFMKAKEGDGDVLNYKIVSRKIEEWN
jgi:hypothetical protein